jgi:hypothetical protein
MRGGDTSLQKEKGVESRMKQRHNPESVVEGASHHFFVSFCHRYDSQQWYLSISYHPRFDQGAIQGRYRSQNSIRARTRGGDTSLQKEKGVVSRMKQRHNPDARVYHEYYLNQAGRGYPVYVGTRYQRVLEHLLPSSVRPGGNTRTENLLPWLRLPRAVLYNLRVENSACRTPGTTLTMD